MYVASLGVTSMDWKLIGKRIRNKRLQCKLTQEQLADFAETSNIYICRIENGVAKPTLTKLKKICEALGCPMSYMVEGKGIAGYDKNAAYISNLLDTCSPYMVGVIRQIVESIIQERKIEQN